MNLGKEFGKNKAGIFFIGKMLLIYISFTLFYDYYIVTSTTIDTQLIKLIIRQAEFLIEFFNYELMQVKPENFDYIGVAGTNGVQVGKPCDGLSLFILFTSFLIVFDGKWWFKIIFITLGILLIHFLNVIRVFALAAIVYHAPDTLDFHHSYTFTLFIYLVIFAFWMLRIKIYQAKKI